MNIDVLKAVLNTEIINVSDIKSILKGESNDFFQELEDYRLILDKEETEVIDELEKIYPKISLYIIEKFSQFYFHMPIEMAIATKEQEIISSLFLDASQKMGFKNPRLQSQINSDLEEIANKLNKRFTFDSAALIHLIEASKGTNIQREELRRRYSKKRKPQILGQNPDNTYKWVESYDEEKYTSGKPIPANHLEEKEQIMLSSYPGASDMITTETTNDIMQKLMKNLFENLNLCFETYKVFYTKENKDDIAISNHAILANDEEFDFNYIINNRNLPHLLGIPPASSLSQDTLNYFSNELTPTSNALDVLRALILNQNRIIADGGLMELNGKFYQIFPWEKIILKTSSFMRGDFFKTCFCLAELHDRHIASPKEKFVSISTTKYDETFTDHKFNAKTVLRDLLLTARQSKDFIFRTFLEEQDRNGNSIYIPQSIMTGKAENILVGKDKDRLKTLDRFRYALDGEDTNPKIVQSIENENMGKRIFTPIEQALTHINIGVGLGTSIELSEEAIRVEEEMREFLDQQLNIDIERIIAQPNKKNRR